MRLRYASCALAALLLAAPALAQPLSVEVPLRGANEVPPVETDAEGLVTVTLDGTTVTVAGSFSGLEGGYAASHLHRGGPNENGPVFQPLAPSVAGEDARAGSFEAALNTFTVSQAIADSIRAGLAYVNVHSSAHPAGEIRGQIAPARAAGALLITGVFDGPLTGGTPKAIELYATADIADLSRYGVGTANNGGGTEGAEFVFPAVSVSAGAFIEVATEQPNFNAFFGEDPDYTDGVASINGDDAVELFYDADDNDEFTSGETIDTFGEISVDGTGRPWEYLDGWAYRKDGTGPDGSTFVLDNWTFSGVDANNDDTANATATNPFPYQSYARPTAGEGDGAAAGLAIAVANPLRGAATVRFETGAAGPARLEAFDLLGRRVALLADGVVSGAEQTATLDAAGLAPGVYVLRLTAGAGTLARTVTVVR